MNPTKKIHLGLFGTVLLTVCLGWLYQQASGTLCYSKLGFIYLANIGFWLAAIKPVRIAFEKKIKSDSLTKSLLVVGIPTLFFNQLIVYAFVEVLFSILYHCESQLVLSELILTNGLLSNAIAFSIIVFGSSYQDIIGKFRTSIGTGSSEIKEVCIKQNGVTHRLFLKDIIRIEADNNAVNIYTVCKRFAQYGRLKDWEIVTANAHLIRVHRSSIVNMDFVQSYQAKPSGDGILVLSNGDKIKVSRNYRSALYKGGKLQYSSFLVSPN